MEENDIKIDAYNRGTYNRLFRIKEGIYSREYDKLDQLFHPRHGYYRGYKQGGLLENINGTKTN